MLTIKKYLINCRSDKREEPKLIKKKNKKRVVFLILTAVMMVGVSLALIFFAYIYNDSRENKIQSGLISMDFTEGTGVINLENTIPVIDEIGLTNTPYTFTITNTSQIPININIKLQINSQTNIDLGAVRYAFYIDDKLILKDCVHDDLILYTYENFKRDETLNCKLVFWIDYYYDKPTKIFNAKIIAEGKSFDIILPTMVEMCPGCVFTYTENTMYYVDGSNERTTLTSSDYKTNYFDVMIESGKKEFLGLILDSDNKISRAFACGVNNNYPFCIEGTIDGSKYTSNHENLVKIFGNYNPITLKGCNNQTSNFSCNNVVTASGDNLGNVSVNETATCFVYANGSLKCNS